MTVTLKPKRFSQTVFVCLGCDLLACSARSDALTCSSQCRVSAHRSGRAREHRDLAKQFDIAPSLVTQIDACRRLLPADTLSRLRSDKVKIDSPEIRAAIWQAFMAVLLRQTKSEAEQ
jgi:hypothetical protein